MQKLMLNILNGPGSLRRCLRFAVLVFGALVAVACEADIETKISVEEDGSGIVTAAVTVDQEAAALILDLESSDGIPLQDVFAAGWVIESGLDQNGLTRIEATKGFGNPEQFQQVMDELAGPNRLFTGFSLTRETGFARVDYAVSGSLRPAGFASFSDPALEEALGESLSSLASRLGASPSDVGVVLQVSLPGALSAEGTDGVQVDGADPGNRFWSTNMGATGGAVAVNINTTTRETGALVALGVSIVAGAVALLLLVGLVLRLFQAERRRKARPVNRPPARTARPEEADVVMPGEDEDVDDSDATAGNPRVVALDGMGVLYGSGADIDEVLIPFCHANGSPLTSDEIVTKARSLSLGNIDPAAFWTAVGIAGDPDELDEEYLSLHALKPGVVKFLRNLRERGVQVVCLTNDSPGWVMKLRRKHSLDGLVDPWIISGNVGARKPDRAIFEVLRRLTGQPPAAIMVVDDQLEILDAARSLGYRTAWFAPDGQAQDARGHSILRSFELPDAPPAEPVPEAVQQ